MLDAISCRADDVLVVKGSRTIGHGIALLAEAPETRAGWAPGHPIHTSRTRSELRFFSVFTGGSGACSFAGQPARSTRLVRGRERPWRHDM